MNVHESESTSGKTCDGLVVELHLEKRLPMEEVSLNEARLRLEGPATVLAREVPLLHFEIAQGAVRVISGNRWVVYLQIVSTETHIRECSLLGLHIP